MKLNYQSTVTIRSAGERHQVYIAEMGIAERGAYFYAIEKIEENIRLAVSENYNSVCVFMPHVLKSCELSSEKESKVSEAVLNAYRINGYVINNGVSRQFIISW